MTRDMLFDSGRQREKRHGSNAGESRDGQLFTHDLTYRLGVTTANEHSVASSISNCNWLPWVPSPRNVL